MKEQHQLNKKKFYSQRRREKKKIIGRWETKREQEGIRLLLSGISS